MPDPIAVYGSKLLHWYEADDAGVVVTGLGVSQWPDLTASAVHFVQATDANRPPLAASILNAKPVIQFDGASDFLGAAMNRPAPGTSPTHFRMIAYQASWNVNDSICAGSGSANFRIDTAPTASPNFRLASNGITNGPTCTGWTALTWHRLKWGLTNSTSDYLQAGPAASLVTGTNTGNGGMGTTFHLGSRNAGGGPANIWVAALVVLNAAPTAPEDDALDAYWTQAARWGPTVVIA